MSENFILNENSRPVNFFAQYRQIHDNSMTKEASRRLATPDSIYCEEDPLLSCSLE